MPRGNWGLVISLRVEDLPRHCLSLPRYVLRRGGLGSPRPKSRNVEARTPHGRDIGDSSVWVREAPDQVVRVARVLGNLLGPQRFGDLAQSSVLPAADSSSASAQRK